MIHNIIFDFGDVFLNLDKPAVYRGLEDDELSRVGAEFYALNCAIETGQISENEFLSALQELFPNRQEGALLERWNSILLDFPEHRLEFLEAMAKEGAYRLFLLSNTNALHIAHVIEAMGSERYNRFRSCFEAFYLSHEIGLRKPDQEIYEFVLNAHDLKASETLFIDDTTENTVSASSLGIQTWNLKPGQEDVTELKSRFLND